MAPETKKKIEKLTKKQQAQLAPFHAEWLAWGTSTARADRAKAEAAILAMRAEIGSKTKPIFIWCDSPATSLLAMHVIKSPQWAKAIGGLESSLRSSLRSSLWSSLRSSLWSSLGSSLESSLRSSLWSSLWSSLESSLWSSLRSSLWSSLWSSLGSSLWSSLESSLRSSLWSSLGSSLRSSLWSSLGPSLWSSLESSLGSSLRSILNEIGYHWWGQHESYWIAFYLFCRDVVGVSYDPQKSRHLDLWRDVAQSCCWLWCFENYVICSERPTVVSMDERNVLHSETGPALAFADGWKVYAWRGTVVPGEWIESKATLDPSIALTDPSVERRRAAASIIGWDKVLGSISSRVIDEDADPQIGTLLEVDLPDAAGSKFLKVRCGTGRTFVLPCPREMKTALEANAWTFALAPDELHLEVRT